MSNYKTTLQSNNESLSSNNTDLQSLIDQANALPDAGGVELPVLINEGTDKDLLYGKQLIDGGGNVVIGMIPTRGSSNISISGTTVTVDDGYYPSEVTRNFDIPNVEQATPSITVYPDGTIVALSMQQTGYVEGGSKTSSKQLTTQAAKTITPTKSSQTVVASGVYTTGAVTVAAIPNEYITTTDATASADEIMSGETAYVNGSKVTGTFSIDSELATQDDLIAQLSAAVNNLPDAGSGEPTLQNKTVTPTTSKQTITADSGYDGLGTVTVNAMTTATQATPSISVNSSGLITASATQTAGYVAAGTKSAIKQLTTQAAQTIIPTTTNKTIASGRYLTGTQTIKGDANLVAGNIKSGVSIFGVAGSYEGSGSGSGGGNVETCTVTIKGDAPLGTSQMIYYTDGSSLKSVEPPDFKQTITITVLKNSIIACVLVSLHLNDDNITRFSYGENSAYFVSGNSSVSAM